MSTWPCGARRVFRRLIVLLCVTACTFGCGGNKNTYSSGSSTTTTPPVQPADFNLIVSPTKLAIGPGDSQVLNVSVSGFNGFTGPVYMGISGLPNGTTASPSTFTFGASGQQQVTLTEASNPTVQSFTLTVNAYSPSISHSTNVPVAVGSEVTAPHAPIRTKYLKTNTAYGGSQYAPPGLTVYDSQHKQFFVSDTYSNEINVYDATQEVHIATISVPLAWSLDISPTNGNLYAGTLLGDVYQIDTATYKLIRRYPAASIGPYGYAAIELHILADGRLALLDGAGGPDGAESAVIWDSVSNTLDNGTPSHPGFEPSICPALTHIGAFNISGDRTRVLMASSDSDATLCSYDPTARLAITNTGFGSFLRQIIPIPGSSRSFVTDATSGVGLFDANTLQLLGKIATPNSYTELPGGVAGAVVSPDGKILYLAHQTTGKIGAWDTTSLNQIGWVPSYMVNDLFQGSPLIGAIDPTGLMVGPAGHGVGFVDAAQLSSTVFTPLSSAFPVPSTGPLSGETDIIGFSGVPPTATINSIYVGNVPGTGITMTNYSGPKVTTPAAAQSGAVDLTTQLTDGSIGIAPEAFSYGPTILEVIPNAATADGGQVGSIFGYGFDSTASSNLVMINGQVATVTSFRIAPVPYNPYPFLVQLIQFTIPPGAGGTAADVTVTTVNGSATAKAAFHYTPAAQSFPITASLQSGIYDPHRDVYYFADQAQIQVLSKTQRKWLSPISLPGTTASSRLLALSESPDGTKLAVSDFGGDAIYVLDPNSPSSVQRFPVTGSNNSPAAPSGLAITNAGTVYFTSTGQPGFYQLATSSGGISALGIYGGGSKDEYDHVLLAPDGIHVYTCLQGNPLILNTSTGKIIAATQVADSTGSESDLSISADGTTVALNGLLADANLNAETIPRYLDLEALPIGVLGKKLNSDGSILYQPLTDGIDMIARNTGHLLYRIQIPDTIPNIYDPLIVDGVNPSDPTVGIITTHGVSFVDLSSLAIPPSDIVQFPLATTSPINTAPRLPGTSTDDSGSIQIQHPELKGGVSLRKQSH